MLQESSPILYVSPLHCLHALKKNRTCTNFVSASYEFKVPQLPGSPSAPQSSSVAWVSFLGSSKFLNCLGLLLRFLKVPQLLGSPSWAPQSFSVAWVSFLGFSKFLSCLCLLLRFLLLLLLNTQCRFPIQIFDVDDVVGQHGDLLHGLSFLPGTNTETFIHPGSIGMAFVEWLPTRVSDSFPYARMTILAVDFEWLFIIVSSLHVCRYFKHITEQNLSSKCISVWEGVLVPPTV